MEPSEKEEIRSRTDIVELVSAYTALRRVGSKFKGLCPFHSEKTPSFTVDPDGRWYCHGACHTGGDVFTFIEKAESLSFIEAAQRLADRAGITLTPRGGDREAAQRSQNEKERVFSANAAALDFYRKCFRRDQIARDYAAKRGLVHETLEDFHVGYAPDDWSQLAEYLLKQKIHPDDAEKAGLIFPSRFEDGTFTDRFRGRLLFPIIDIQERIVGFGGRLIGDVPNAPKYLNSPESPVFSKSKVLYGLNRARKAIQQRDAVLVVEGYMDVVAAHQAGIEFVVATLGTALTEDHIRLIRRYTKNVVLSFDADEAGVKAALRAAELAQSTGEDLSLRVLVMPPGEDPDSLIKKGGAAGFHKAIEGALTVPDFRLKSLETKHDLTTEAGKIALLREAVAIIAAVPSLLEQEVLIRHVSHHHPGYPVNSIRAEESVRAEVRRSSGRNGVPIDDPTLPTATQNGYRRSGSGAAPSGGYRREDFRGQNGAPRGKQPYGQPQRPFVLPNQSATPIQPTAAQAAERTLLRALLADEWSPILRSHIVDPANPPFVEQETTRLFYTVWSLISAGIAPSDVVGQIADPALGDLADSVQMAAEGVPLTDDQIVDAIRLIDMFKHQQEIDQIRTRLSDSGEGNVSEKDELLRQWSEKARTLKGAGKRSEEE